MWKTKQDNCVFYGGIAESKDDLPDISVLVYLRGAIQVTLDAQHPLGHSESAHTVITRAQASVLMEEQEVILSF